MTQLTGYSSSNIWLRPGRAWNLVFYFAINQQS
jgi:hypothetical protein